MRHSALVRKAFLAAALVALAADLAASADGPQSPEPAADDSADRSGLPTQIVVTTDVALDGRRERVRTTDTPLGSLIADAFVWQAEQSRGPAVPQRLAVTNGGAIRNDSLIQPGDLTAADIQTILPFADSVVVLEGVSVADLVQALEISTASFPGQSGGFLQVSGFSFEFTETTGAVQSIRLADDTLIYTSADGDRVGSTFELVTNSFVAGGGDGYGVLSKFPLVDLGMNPAVALQQFVQQALGGAVRRNSYRAPGLGRITVAVVPEPATLGLALIGLLALAVRRRVRLYRRGP